MESMDFSLPLLPFFLDERWGLVLYCRVPRYIIYMSTHSFMTCYNTEGKALKIVVVNRPSLESLGYYLVPRPQSVLPELSMYVK